MVPSKVLVPHELTRARSDVLDAFAELEHVVTETALAWAPEAPGKNATLGQKLDKLADIKAGSSLSHDRRKIISEAVAEAQNLCEIRNDVVHSRLRLAVGDPQTCVYLNTRSTDPVARVMSVQQHVQIAEQASALARRIREWHYAPKK
jgi:hypothetical protein